MYIKWQQGLKSEENMRMCQSFQTKHTSKKLMMYPEIRLSATLHNTSIKCAPSGNCTHRGVFMGALLYH